MQIEAVLFDWNGTLFDDLEKLAYGSVVKIFATYNIAHPTLEEYRQEITAKFMDFYYRYGFKENFSGGGSKGDADALNVIRKKYYLDHNSEGIIREDAFSTVFDLVSSGIRVGIVSAEIEESLLDRLTSHDLNRLIRRKFIKAGVYGDKVPALIEMCELLNVKPESAIYLDDTFDGTSAAKKAGMISVGFANKTGYNSEERLKTATNNIIFELSELLVLIERLNRNCNS